MWTWHVPASPCGKAPRIIIVSARFRSMPPHANQWNTSSSAGPRLADRALSITSCPTGHAASKLLTGARRSPGFSMSLQRRCSALFAAYEMPPACPTCASTTAACRRLLSCYGNPAVSPQVPKEISGHISQRMQNRYSIQTFLTKKAALDTLDAPPPTPVDPEATMSSRRAHHCVSRREGPCIEQRAAVRPIIQHFRKGHHGSIIERAAFS